MNYGNSQFGLDLLSETEKGFDVVRISRWAYERYISCSREVSLETKANIMKIVAMEEGPEFEMDEAEVRQFARSLIEQKIA
ncbi:MAG: hypothetical protein H6686_09130 [Fibrobacteria bacterium]|nr:hypothetical protein [Fibrobacteria bacterium]